MRSQYSRLLMVDYKFHELVHCIIGVLSQCKIVLQINTVIGFRHHICMKNVKNPQCCTFRNEVFNFSYSSMQLQYQVSKCYR